MQLSIPGFISHKTAATLSQQFTLSRGRSMSTQQLPDLSKAEYEVLHVLWKAKAASVRELHDQLSNGWAYTTTKTVMDRMVKKELLSRESIHGVFVYRPLISRPAGLARLVSFFANRVLEQDTDSVVAMFAKNQSLSKKELEELSKLVEGDNNPR
ncbi:BlaI/MecI/CopY family transcriptional regulator [Microbulbifer pacificus]|uniref:BlaI/MecI/CopY family transcriptional regulator n=1 Tax=Microbulbifer pacificus TaxID=407164 RepID=A0AAU0MZC9_9GAMM|nr:BlaI/MecI/CopY family transcriptional regulator [Microbulbifer pacificus]WOX05106.1 BlaI/MecI/CopY family transcriptional regulator [Microbulbifer pacificus]